MNELSESAKQLIEAARPGDEITEADRQRVAQGLTTKLGASVLAGTAVSTSVTSVAAATGSKAALGATSLATLLVWGAGGLGLGLAAMGVASVVGASTQAEVAQVIAQSAALKPMPNVQAANGTRAIAIIQDTVPPADVTGSEAASPSVPRRGHALVARSELDALPTASARGGSLDEEVAVLRGAHAALQSGDAQRALALLDHHALHFRDGALREERAAQRILALCSAHRTSEAAAEARRFLKTSPRSPLAPRVRASCVGDEAPLGRWGHGESLSTRVHRGPMRGGV